MSAMGQEQKSALEFGMSALPLDSDVWISHLIASVPFAHQPGARLQAETWIRSDSAFGPEHLRESLQLAPRRFAEPAMLDFLKGDS